LFLIVKSTPCVKNSGSVLFRDIHETIIFNLYLCAARSLNCGTACLDFLRGVFDEPQIIDIVAACLYPESQPAKSCHYKTVLGHE